MSQIDLASRTAATTSTSPRPRREVFAGMDLVDTSGSVRLPVLMEMVGALSRATQPQDVLRAYAAGIRRLDGPAGFISASTRDLPPGAYKITRFVHLDAPDGDLATPDPWNTWNALPVHEGGVLGELMRSAYPHLIHNLSVRDDPVLGDELAGYGSMMAIPLLDAGEPVNWAFMLRREPDGFSIDDLEQTMLRGNLVGGTIRNTLIARQLRDANATIRDEVDRIARIQRALLPEDMPDIAGVELAASYATYDQAGGDYYDVLPMHRPDDDGRPSPDRPWALLIADASGHGPAAAVIMAMLHAMLHAYPHCDAGPGRMLGHINRHLSRKRIESSFVTAFVGMYDPPTRTLTYARAGHPPPLLKSAGAGSPVRLIDEPSNVPLGVLDDTVYDEASVVIEPGQSLVLYTDGVNEARSPDGEMFGLQRLEAALTVCTGEPECVVDSVMNALREHEAGVRPADDQTIVVMKVR